MPVIHLSGFIETCCCTCYRKPGGLSPEYLKGLDIIQYFPPKVQLFSGCPSRRVFSRSFVSNSVTPWTAAHQASLSITNSWILLQLMSIKLVVPSNRLILYYPLLPPSIFPNIRVFSSEAFLHIR